MLSTISPCTTAVQPRVYQHQSTPLVFSPSSQSPRFSGKVAVHKPLLSLVLMLGLSFFNPSFSQSQPNKKNNDPVEQLYKVIDNPCGCDDEDGNAPPTLRFSRDELEQVLQRNPTLRELLPPELLADPENPDTQYIFNPHRLSEDALKKQRLLKGDEELIPLGNSPYLLIKQTEKTKPLIL